MAGMIDSLSTLNSVIRTALAVGLVGVVGACGWFGYQKYNASDQDLQNAQQELNNARNQIEEKDHALARQHKQIEAKDLELEEKNTEILNLNDQVAEQQEEIARLDTAMRLLKVDHRVAWLRVLEQGKESETDEAYSIIEFVEMDQHRQAIGQPKQYKIKGSLVYVDSWIVKYEDKYIEAGTIDRATSLVLFRRIFGEGQKPINGFPLDTEGRRPEVYGQGAAMSELDKKIWGDFWNIAHDEVKAGELGIRAAHGEAVSIEPREGASYRIELRASGGLTISRDTGQPPKIKGPAT